jgi:hypothetical protein
VKTLTAIAAFSLCFAGIAYAQMDQQQSASTRATLNAQQADAAHQQVEQNEASQQEHDAAVASGAAASDHNDRVYDHAMREHHHDVREYHRAMRAWQEDVTACNAGDRSRCDRPRPIY